MVQAIVPVLVLALAVPLALASPPFKPAPRRTRGLVRPTAEAAAPAQVERVRYQADQQSTRVIVLLSRSVPYEVTVLPGEASRGSERRVVLDFSNAKLGADATAPIGVEDGLLKQIRTGQFTARTARVVLDLASVTGHHVTALDDPPRVVIDITGKPVAATRESPNETAESVPPAPRPEGGSGSPPRSAGDAGRAVSEVVTPPTPLAEPTPRGKDDGARASRRPAVAEPNKPGAPVVPVHRGADERAAGLAADTDGASAAKAQPGAEAAAASSRDAHPSEDLATAEVPPPGGALPRRATPWRIVLDPGHGGNDPGTLGIDHVLEKNVTLAIAKQLKRRLEEGLGAQVLLTRDRDVTRSLAERTAFANASNADVFVSIHANADVSGELHGIETYTLNNTDDRAAIRLAKMENGPGVRTGRGDLSFILSDMVQSGKEEDSIALANRLQQHLLFTLRSHYPDVRNLGVKKGPFYVLVGAYMPCVLVETSFLSHPIEGRRLASGPYQEEVVEGLYLGMADYLGTQRLAKTL